MPEGSRLVLPDADPAGRLRILRAVYGVLTEHPTVMPEPLFVDMAAPLAARIAGDSIEVVASNDLAGDPLLNVQKKLEVDYRLDGLAATARVAEGKRIEIGALRWATDPLVPRLVSAAGAGCTLEAWEGGRYELVRAGGAPARVSLEKLISWPRHADPGVRCFSGTAVYETSFELPGEFGVLSKRPHLWPNRLIGDELHPDDFEWSGSTLARWPEWFLEHRPRPVAERVAFTTWKHWSKDSMLLPSGLIGPVRLVPQARLAVER